MKLGLAPLHLQVGTQLCLKVVSGLASHRLPLNQVGEGKVEELRMSWSEPKDFEMFFWGEGNRKVIPCQKVGLPARPEHAVLLGDSRSSLEPAQPRSPCKGWSLKAAFAFLAPANCRRHEGLELWWFGFGEFVTLGRKPCSFPKDMQELSGNARLV